MPSPHLGGDLAGSGGTVGCWAEGWPLAEQAVVYCVPGPACSTVQAEVQWTGTMAGYAWQASKSEHGSQTWRLRRYGRLNMFSGWDACVSTLNPSG